MTRLLRSSKIWLLSRALLVVIGFMIAGVSPAQTLQNGPRVGAGGRSGLSRLRGVKIGWIADEVRKKLGNPANKGDEQDYYMFGEKETSRSFTTRHAGDGDLRRLHRRYEKSSLRSRCLAPTSMRSLMVRSINSYVIQKPVTGFRTAEPPATIRS